MHDHGNGRRGALRNLFAERRVHVRSGHESRYVVLSPGLQIGVALGGVALVGLLAATSYNAISGRLELAAQQRTLNELTADKTEAELAAEQREALRRRTEAAEAEITRLTEALAQAEGEAGASAELAALQAELAAATAENSKLADELEEARTTGRADAAKSAEIEALHAEITGLRAEIDRLEREATSLRRAASQAQQVLVGLQAPPALATPPGPPGEGEAGPERIVVASDPAQQEVLRLQQDLAGAQATIDALSADLDAAKSPRPGAGPVRPATIAETDLASLKAQISAANQRVEQLGASLAAAPEDPPASPRQPVVLPSPPAPR